MRYCNVKKTAVNLQSQRVSLSAVNIFFTAPELGKSVEGPISIKVMHLGVTDMGDGKSPDFVDNRILVCRFRISGLH